MLLLAGPLRADDLDSRFHSPPADTRPWVYWYWMNGNITPEGIRADLQAMQDVGIGGAMTFDIGLHPAGPVKVRSRQWYDLVKFAVQEAATRNIKVSFHSPGWTASGGPWITPEMAMQELTWSETCLEGPRDFSGVLPRPPAKLGWYRDAVVIAFLTPEGDELSLKEMKPRFLDAAGKPIPGMTNLFEGNLDSAVSMPSEFFIVFEQPVSARSLFIRTRNQPGLESASLQGWSLETKAYQPVADLKLRAPGTGSSHIGSATFSAVRTRFFRVAFSTLARGERVMLEQLDLRGGFRVADWPNKAGFGCDRATPAPAADSAQPQDIVPPDYVVDLTGKLDPDGKLTWPVPAGRWTVLRLGHTATGMHIYPPPTGADGLECDKLSREAADFHYDHMMKPLLSEFGPELARQALACYHVDSYEAGWQNWSRDFPQEFRKRRGYDLLHYLPALTGRVVGNSATTERFLWDFRRTIADLYADNHYGRLAERCHQDGLGFSTEPYGGPFESLQCGGRADHPMTEFWLPGNPRGRKPAFEAVFAGRTTGKRIIAAESFTSEEPWTQHPFSVKALGDSVFCSGVNQLVLHVFAHQPYTNDHLRPGFTCGGNGLHFDRGNTWWSQGRAWVSYLTRCQSLLQTGEHVADVLYFQGDDAPNAAGPFEPALPDGYDFDVCGTDVFPRLAVRDGRVVLPTGKSYRYLVLPAQGHLTLASLRKAAELARSGATVIGPPAKESPSLADYPACTEQIVSLRSELWGGDKPAAYGTRPVGQGRVIWGEEFTDILKKDRLEPDFDFDASVGLVIHYIHRQTASADVYFVANASDGAGWVNCRFRLAGKVPELWRPDSGSTESYPFFEEAGGATRIPLHFDPAGSLFVIFRHPVSSQPALVGATRDGVDVLARRYSQSAPPAAPDQNRGITNDFAMALWVRPAGDIPLPEQTTNGITWDNQNWAIYPPPGHVLYGDGHAGAGVSVGRNGVCVFEHWAGNAPAVLVYQAPSRLVDWTHVAVLFRDRRPHLFINGKFVRAGLRGGETVHSGVGVGIPPSHQVAPFQGWLAEISQYTEPLDDSDIARLADARPESLPTVSETPAIEFAADALGTLRAEASEPGHYVLKFRNGGTRSLEVSALPKPVEIAGPWTVRFPKGWGAPPEIELSNLVSWSEYPSDGVRHFSGTAEYEIEFDVPAGFTPNRALALDLGDVQVIAEPVLNGHELGVLWKQPFRVNVTEAVKPGRNKLHVRVTNLWPNRLIGDEQYPDDCAPRGAWASGGIPVWPDWLLKGRPRTETRRYTFATYRYWNRKSMLLPAGLLGPVTLQAAKQVEIK
jgi:hypothetical protein